MQTGGQKRETKRIIYCFKRVEMGEDGKRGIIEVLWRRKDLTEWRGKVWV